VRAIVTVLLGIQLMSVKQRGQNAKKYQQFPILAMALQSRRMLNVPAALLLPVNASVPTKATDTEAGLKSLILVHLPVLAQELL
jgi:hypothetical protein